MITRLYRFLFGNPAGVPVRSQSVYVWLLLWMFTSFFYHVRWSLYGIMPLSIIDKIPKVLFLLAGICFLISFFRSSLPSHRNNPRATGLFVCGMLWCFFSCAQGVLFNRGEVGAQTVISETMYFLMFFITLKVGSRGEFLEKSIKYLVILFYLTAVLMFFVKGVNFIRLDDAGVERAADEFRNTTSVAYVIRGALNFFSFLFPLGFFYHKKLSFVTRLLCVATILPFAYFNAYMFKFRNSLIALALSCTLVVFFSLRTGRLRNIVLISVLALVGVGAYFGNVSYDFRERVAQANERHQGDVIDIYKGERFVELGLFWESFSPVEVFIGKGFGGRYDASYYFGDKGCSWGSLHIGALFPMLFGGFVLLILFWMTFLKSSLRPLSLLERRDGLSVTCKCQVLHTAMLLIFTPMSAVGYAFFTSMPLWLSMATLLSPARDREQEILFGSELK